MREGYETVGDPLRDDPEHWKPGTFGFHELLDRVRLVADLWNEKVYDHASAKHDAEISRRTDEIGMLMEELYQYVGGLGAVGTNPSLAKDGQPKWGS